MTRCGRGICNEAIAGPEGGFFFLCGKAASRPQPIFLADFGYSDFSADFLSSLLRLYLVDGTSVALRDMRQKIIAALLFISISEISKNLVEHQV